MYLEKGVFMNASELYEGRTAKLTYTGDLYRNNADEVYVHYGYGLLWDKLSEIKMTKTETGFEAYIPLASADSFNFCFRDNNSSWDNNSTQNYSFGIGKQCSIPVTPMDPTTALVVTPKLSRNYIRSKKVKILFYRLFAYIPRMVTGNADKNKDLFSILWE